MAEQAGSERRGRCLAATALVALAALLLPACVPLPPSPPAVKAPLVSFPAQRVDPAISLSGRATNLAGRPAAEPRGRLVVLLHGSGADGLTMAPMAKNLVDAGYHIVAPSYEATLGTLDLCPNTVRATMPDCHRKLRGEATFGEGVQDPLGRAEDHPGLKVPVANALMNSLLKQLDHLQRTYPLEGWEQFIVQTDGVCDAWSETYGACGLRWDRVALVGYSQGGGVALHLAKVIHVARVGMISAPFDVFGPTTDPLVSPSITDGGYATPVSDIVQLSHELETHRWRQLAVANALGLPGPPTNIESASPPYGGSNQLVSSAKPICRPLSEISYHLAPAGGYCTDETLYQTAWRYLAGGDLD